MRQDYIARCGGCTGEPVLPSATLLDVFGGDPTSGDLPLEERVSALGA